MYYIIFDLEWNNAYNYKTKKGFNEIIEIGAVKLDKNFNIVGTFKQLIKPQVSKKLSSRFKNLTHITSEEIKEKGIPFENAVSDFARWSENDKSVFMSWSNSDLYVLVDNFQYFFGKTTVDFMKKYADVQKFCQRNIKTENSNQIGLSNCAELLNISVDSENLHRALEDCYLAAKCFEKVYDEKEFKNYISVCDFDFFERLIFKPYYITKVKTDNFNADEVEFNCPICGSKLNRLTEYECKCSAFKAVGECKPCKKKWWIFFRAKQTYDTIHIYKRVTEMSRNKSRKIK